MRWLGSASIVLLAALPCFAQEAPPTVTPTTKPTPTTIVGRPRAPRGVEGMPAAMPGFGMPGPKPKDEPPPEARPANDH